MNEQPSYLDLARTGRGRWWWYLLGTIIIVAAWQLTALVTSVVAAAADLPAWASTGFTLIGFLGLFLAVPFVTRFINGRRWKSVVTPYRQINWGLIGKGALFWGLPLLVTQLLLLPLDSDGLRLTTDIGGWLALVAVVLLLVGFQTTAEELLFRGYLLQWASLASRNVWVLSVVSGFFFTLPHLANPEVTSVAGAELAVTVLVYFVIGFVFGWVSITSGTIELAIGAHFINNVLSFTLVSAETSVAGSSLIVDTSPNMYLSLLGILVSAAVFLYLTRNLRGSGELMPELVQGPEAVAEAEVAVEEVAEAEVVAEVEEAAEAEAELEPEPDGTAAGWYVDPSDEAQVRWWDGEAWTHHTQERPTED